MTLDAIIAEMPGRGIQTVRQAAVDYQNTIPPRWRMQPDQRPVDPIDAISRIADILGEKSSRNDAGRVKGYPAFLYRYILPVEIRQAGEGWTGLMGRRSVGRDRPGAIRQMNPHGRPLPPRYKGYAAPQQSQYKQPYNQQPGFLLKCLKLGIYCLAPRLSKKYLRACLMMALRATDLWSV